MRSERLASGVVTDLVARVVVIVLFSLMSANLFADFVRTGHVTGLLLLASESLAKKCTDAGIDREMRSGKEPSDHAPVWAEFEE